MGKFSLPVFEGFIIIAMGKKFAHGTHPDETCSVEMALAPDDLAILSKACAHNAQK